MLGKCVFACLAGTLLGIAFMLIADCAIARGAEKTTDLLNGKASFYGEEYRGKITAYGERFDPDQNTCATWFYPHNALLRVTHGNRVVYVRVNDRGPANRYVEQGRIIDLAAAPFAKLAPASLGVISVSIVRVQ
jgi:rare lipoprotein A